MATPQSRGLDFLREREILYPEGIEGGTRLIPLDLTSVSNQEIGHLHSEWAARLAYAIAVVGEVETQIAGCKAVLAKGGDKDQLQAEIRSLQVDFTQSRAAEKATDVLMKACSREITRRVSERAPQD